VKNPLPSVVLDWRRRGAIEWTCRSCGLTIGYILDGEFCSFHRHRKAEVPMAGPARQTCDRCGYENRYDLASGPS
jgi:RNase P subunit RPR2